MKVGDFPLLFSKKGINMRDFSIAECLKRLDINGISKLDKMRSLYCNLDKLILGEKAYLKECMFKRSFELAEDVERDTFRGILLRAVKMGMEAELGGAIKQEAEHLDRMLSKVGMSNETVTGRIFFVSMPEDSFSFILSLLSEDEKAKARSDIEAGNGKYYTIFGHENDEVSDNHRRFELACDLMDLDKIQICATSSFLQGSEINMKMAIDNQNIADKIENEWQLYRKMTPAERIADFNHFLKEIRYVNGLEPRPIIRHDDNMHDDNQNQR